MADDRSEWRALLDLADLLEPSMRAAFLAAVGAVADRVHVAALTAAMAAGDVARAERILRAAAATFQTELAPAVRLTREAFVAAGVQAAAPFTLAFAVSNPRAAQWAATEGSRLITRLTAQQRELIRGFVRHAIADGATRRELSTLIRPVLGLTARDERAVRAFRAQLLDAGVTGDRAGLYAERLLRRRARTIARTELMDASNRGRLELWHQAVAAGRLRPDVLKVWVVTPDDRLCPRCQPLRGEAVALTARFSCGRLAPPLHPNCRCTVVLRQATARRAA